MGGLSPQGRGPFRQRRRTAIQTTTRGLKMFWMLWSMTCEKSGCLKCRPCLTQDSLTDWHAMMTIFVDAHAPSQSPVFAACIV